MINANPEQVRSVLINLGIRSPIEDPSIPYSAVTGARHALRGEPRRKGLCTCAPHPHRDPGDERGKEKPLMKHPRKQEGAVLFVVLMIVMVGTASALFSATTVSHEVRGTGFARQQLQTRYAARSALIRRARVVRHLRPRSRARHLADPRRHRRQALHMHDHPPDKLLSRTAPGGESPSVSALPGALRSADRARRQWQLQEPRPSTPMRSSEPALPTPRHS